MITEGYLARHHMGRRGMAGPALLDVAQDDREAGAGGCLGDAVAHRARADHTNRLEFGCHVVYLSTARATALPPPRQSAAMPRFALRRLIS